MFRLAITVALLSGCAAGVPIEGFDELPLVEVAEPTPPTVPVFSFSVIGDYPEVLEASKTAAERWHNATKWKVEIVPSGGIPIRVWPRIWTQVSEDGNYVTLAVTPEGEGTVWRSLCGNTFLDGDVGLDISTFESCGLLSTVVHEMGHMLNGEGGHSDTGVMAAGGDPDRTREIDMSSWDLICSGQPCWGEPESLGE